MVSNSALAAVCVWSGLQEHLLFESYILAGSIQAYADELKAKQVKEYELAEKEDRSPGQYWLEIEPPKVNQHPYGQRSTNNWSVGSFGCRRIHHWRHLHLGGFLTIWCGGRVRQRAQAFLRSPCDIEDTFSPSDKDSV